MATTLIDVLELGEVQLPKWHPRSEQGPCPIRAFAIHHPDGLILVDTGVGYGNSMIDEEFQPTVKPIIGALNRVGIDERSVAAIVNTHLHFDHCGQNSALPSTPVFVQSAELAAAQVPDYTVDDWAHIEPQRQRIIDGDEMIATGVQILATPGHSPGHQSVLVEDGDGHSHLIAGQCCYTCAEFETGQVNPADFLDLAAGAESMKRLRRLNPDVAYFSHDLTVYRPSE